MKPDGAVKYWRSSKCEHAEVVEPQDSYAVGDDEPCVHCADRRCVATVEQGRHVVDIGGSSPRERDA